MGRAHKGTSDAPLGGACIRIAAAWGRGAHVSVAKTGLALPLRARPLGESTNLSKGQDLLTAGSSLQSSESPCLPHQSSLESTSNAPSDRPIPNLQNQNLRGRGQRICILAIPPEDAGASSPWLCLAAVSCRSCCQPPRFPSAYGVKSGSSAWCAGPCCQLHLPLLHLITRVIAP